MCWNQTWPRWIANGLDFLPEEVWDKLSDQEKREAERTKEKGSKSGEQYVDWTPAIKRAMAAAGYAPDGSDNSKDSDSSDNSRQEPTKKELYEEAKELGVEGRSKMNKADLNQAVQEEKS